MEIATVIYNINTAEKNETSQYEIWSGQCLESKLCIVFLGTFISLMHHQVLTVNGQQGASCKIQKWLHLLEMLSMCHLQKLVQ